MANKMTDQYLANNTMYASGQAVHKPNHQRKSSILNHPWIPTSGLDAITVRGFTFDVDTGKLEEVSYPGPMGSFA